MANPKAEHARLQAVVKKMKKAPIRPVSAQDEIDQRDNSEENAHAGAMVPTQKAAAAAFLTKEKATVQHYRPAKVKLPKWLTAKIESKASPKEVLEYLVDRVKKAPSKDSLVLMQMVFNEIGRRPEGNIAIRQVIQQHNMVEFIQSTQTPK
jgi:hypothetical protein